MADCILRDQPVQEKVSELRRRFLDMRYCFVGGDMDTLIQQLHQAI
jgi:hypothetical protein